MIQLPKGSKLLSTFLTGSHLYGTNTPDSDTDTRGVFVSPREHLLGLANCFKVEDKIEELKTDQEEIERVARAIAAKVERWAKRIESKTGDLPLPEKVGRALSLKNQVLTA